MRRRHMHDMHAAHPNVTPLIDVVMVLIVFFMLVAKIGVDTGADPNIIVPPTILGTEIKDLGNYLVLNVVPVGDEPQVTALIENIQEQLPLIDPASGQRPLLNALKKFRFGTDFRDGGTGPEADNPEFKVIIRADADLDYRFIEPVLVACAEARVGELAYNTQVTQEVVTKQ